MRQETLKGAIPVKRVVHCRSAPCKTSVLLTSLHTYLRTRHIPLRQMSQGFLHSSYSRLDDSVFSLPRDFDKLGKTPQSRGESLACSIIWRARGNEDEIPRGPTRAQRCQECGSISKHVKRTRLQIWNKRVASKIETFISSSKGFLSCSRLRIQTCGVSYLRLLPEIFRQLDSQPDEIEKK